MAISAAALGEKYAPKSETYRIRVTENPEDDWVARSVSDIREMSAFARTAQQLMKNAEKNNLTPEWKTALKDEPLDLNLAHVVVTIAAVVMEPKVSQLEVLKLCQTAGAVVLRIHAAIMAQMQIDIPQVEEELIDETKNASVPTVEVTSDTSSSAGTTSTSTRATGKMKTGTMPASISH